MNGNIAGDDSTARFETGLSGPQDDLSDLVRRAATRDMDAWSMLIDRYARRLYALAKSRLHDSHLAEEVSQAVFTTAFEHITTGRYTEQGRFESWLFRIAMNRIRDHIRRTRRARTQLLDESLEHAQPSTGISSPDEIDNLRLAISSLPDSDQEIISLRHQAGLEFKAIADMLDEPVGTLLARHHRAIRKVRTMLEARTTVQSNL